MKEADMARTSYDHRRTLAGPALTQRVWRDLARMSFAVLSYATPTGQPRCSGVVYAVADRRLYVAVAVDSWKARHIAVSGRVGVTVPVRRGGLLSLVFPIPPATISFHGSAVVHTTGTLDNATLSRLVPAERRAECRVIEIVPQGHFVTYGIGVPLMDMRVPDRSRAWVPVA
jgi:hypothetical protein